jgi:hypothetical protein
MLGGKIGLINASRKQDSVYSSSYFMASFFISIALRLGLAGCTLLHPAMTINKLKEVQKPVRDIADQPA